MNITRAYALANGYTIDDHCNPPIAYKGPRFNPHAWTTTYTEREEELIEVMKEAVRWSKINHYTAANLLKAALKDAGVDVE